MKGLLRAVSALIIVCWAVLCAGASSMVQKQYFSLVLPEGFEISSTVPMMDFEVYTVTRDGTPYVGIYVGNQPKFPRLKPSAHGALTDLKTSGFEMVALWESDRLARREILVELKSSGWPTRLHAWTAPLPIDQVPAADRILSSIIVAGAKTVKP